MQITRTARKQKREVGLETGVCARTHTRSHSNAPLLWKKFDPTAKTHPCILCCILQTCRLNCSLSLSVCVSLCPSFPPSALQAESVPQSIVPCDCVSGVLITERAHHTGQAEARGRGGVGGQQLRQHRSHGLGHWQRLLRWAGRGRQVRPPAQHLRRGEW